MGKWRRMPKYVHYAVERQLGKKVVLKAACKASMMTSMGLPLTSDKTLVTCWFCRITHAYMRW